MPLTILWRYLFVWHVLLLSKYEHTSPKNTCPSVHGEPVCWSVGDGALSCVTAAGHVTQTEQMQCCRIGITLFCSFRIMEGIYKIMLSFTAWSTLFIMLFLSVPSPGRTNGVWLHSLCYNTQPLLMYTVTYCWMWVFLMSCYHLPSGVLGASRLNSHHPKVICFSQPMNMDGSLVALMWYWWSKLPAGGQRGGWEWLPHP